MSGAGPERVTVARVVKPHGVRGELSCELLTDVPDRLAPGTAVTVGELETRVTTRRVHQGRVLLGLEAVDDRTTAEGLRGDDVRAEPLDADAPEVYFAHELVGMAVHDDAGDLLGHVRALVELPAAAEYDLLEVARPDGRVWLLPAVDEYVVVDVDAAGAEHLVVVEPPEGLLDDARG